MIPWVHVDTAEIPGGEGTLRLKRRGAEFSIMLGDNELMNSRLSGSEQALATLACERLADRPAAETGTLRLPSARRPARRLCRACRPMHRRDPARRDDWLVVAAAAGADSPHEV